MVGQNDKVTLVLPPENDDERILVSHERIKVVYEDENWLLLDKPAGISSVPGPSNDHDTMMNRVKGYLIDQKRKSCSSCRNKTGQVYKRTDALRKAWVCTRTDFKAGSGTFDGKTVFGRVLWICQKDHGIIDLPLKKEDNGFRRIVSCDGQNAVTEYWVRERFGNEATLVECVLHTGRTHQIRAHFAHFAHPLISDELYGGKNDACKRQALHACRLAFDDPFSCKRLRFELPLENDMEHLLGN